jgi:hypothetical protein
MTNTGHLTDCISEKLRGVFQRFFDSCWPGKQAGQHDYGCLRQPERFMFKATCSANRTVFSGKHNKFTSRKLDYVFINHVGSVFLTINLACLQEARNSR